MEDLNAKVGKERTADITGQYGLGTRSEHGKGLIEFCQQNELIITNTYFKQHPRNYMHGRVQMEVPEIR